MAEQELEARASDSYLVPSVFVFELFVLLFAYVISSMDTLSL